MWKQLNFKWDRRTLYNVLKVPFIILIRIPGVLFLWGIEWINEWSNVIADKLPAWKT